MCCKYPHIVPLYFCWCISRTLSHNQRNRRWGYCNQLNHRISRLHMVVGLVVGCCRMVVQLGWHLCHNNYQIRRTYIRFYLINSGNYHP
jgi:hypothetical protein